MASSILLFGTDSDLQALLAFANASGLHLQAMAMGGKVASSAKDGPYCYLSPVAESELHPFGAPQVRITPARDPLLGFMRPYFTDPYLVCGHIQWSNDVPTLAAQTKPYYQGLARWIRKEWEKHGDSYVGPEAANLIERGAQLVAALPGEANVTTITP
jgi:hypothetical protein